MLNFNYLNESQNEKTPNLSNFKQEFCWDDSSKILLKHKLILYPWEYANFSNLLL